jgi:hypothetical protein
MAIKIGGLTRRHVIEKLRQRPLSSRGAEKLGHVQYNHRGQAADIGLCGAQQIAWHQKGIYLAAAAFQDAVFAPPSGQNYRRLHARMRRSGPGLAGRDAPRLCRLEKRAKTRKRQAALLRKSAAKLLTQKICGAAAQGRPGVCGK